MADPLPAEWTRLHNHLVRSAAELELAQAIAATSDFYATKALWTALHAQLQGLRALETQFGRLAIHLGEKGDNHRNALPPGFKG